jgi:glyoxylase-like metal-dependent hydrolase (beta-lactamase superfamily II)
MTRLPRLAPDATSCVLDHTPQPNRQKETTMNTALRIPTTFAFALAVAACGPDAQPEPDPPEESDPVQAFDACEVDFTITEPNPNYVWTPNAIQLVSEEVAPGVFAVYDDNAASYGPAGIPLATSGGFVIGEDGVALVDTMINRQLFCQLVDLVREQTDKPVLYAINTSYHGDHSYGNDFLPDEVEVVQHERTAEYISQYFEEDIAFMEANFGDDQGLDELSAVAPDIAVTDDGWSADLGGLTVEARYHGFGQTVGDLFVYVPEAQVMWTGNPLIAEAPAIPWLLDGKAAEVSATLASVRDSLPSAAVVVPGHGRPVEVGTFDFSVGYLDALIDDVQASVDDGLDVDQTAAAVTLPDYQGYALWDWVHSVVNVPNTHAELSQ